MTGRPICLRSRRAWQGLDMALVEAHSGEERSAPAAGRRVRRCPARRADARPRRFRDGQADPRASGYSAYPDHLPNGLRRRPCNHREGVFARGRGFLGETSDAGRYCGRRYKASSNSSSTSEQNKRQAEQLRLAERQGFQQKLADGECPPSRGTGAAACHADQHR